MSETKQNMKFERENPLLEGLNQQQREAVLHTRGPLLILAGAGSGKTRVLTHRIGYLMEQGVMPWEILAITFTNKAAGEMRERVDHLLPGSGRDVFVSTFHSMCVRMLRRDIDRLGYARDFTIYDGDDQRTLMKQVIRSLEFDPKVYRERAVLSVISAAKNEMLEAEDYRAQAADFYERNVAQIFEEYEKQKKSNNAVDFDDLLLLTVKLFREFPDVLAGWQERFQYIMVDEYQDTNSVQFELVRMLSARYQNLCVVGDDDQSIYKFRGANIQNILSFEHSFPGAKVIKLEQNYRSTKRILEAANEVIKNNFGRKEKRLWTENDEGELPVFHEYDTAAAEADAIVREASSCGLPLRQQAVLYRTNAQSRLLEEKCIQQNVPYVIVGGVNFYQRREIKDVLSYLRITANGVDDLACERIINVPKRGIGQTSVERVKRYAEERGLSMYDALKRADEIPGIGAAAKKIKGFVEVIEAFRRKAEAPELSIKELIASVRDDTGYAEELKKEGEVESQTRLENIEELINKAADYQETEGDGEKSLAGFLEEVSLIADIDRTDDSDDVLTMMTLHAAKGLEFDKIYLSGMEEGLFPSSMAINADRPEEEIEEERRLCYVGMTRARKELRLSSARERMVHGEIHYGKVSRFIDELPETCVRKEMRRARAASWESYDDDYDNPIPKRGFAGTSSFASQYGGFGAQKPAAGRGAGALAFGESAGVGMSGTGGSGAYGSAGIGNAGAAAHSRIMGAYGSLDKTPAFGKGMPRRGAQGAGLSGIQKGAAIGGAKPDYEVGDRVSHIKFGAGTVTALASGKKDYEVTVAFDEGGTKRMLAGFAKLKKL